MPGQGNQPLAPTMDGETKVFDLTVDPIKHQIDAQIPAVDALGFNGTWPGPRIDVTEGDQIRAIFTNRMAESTGIHFHGQRLPNAMDGVPHVTQDPIPPGGSFTYEFVAKSSGSHMYHSHHNATDQVGRGLLGAFIVQPKDPAQRYDKLYGATQDIVWISNDALGGFTINGRGFPATAPIVATLGETIVIRFMNEGNMMHPWHLHGMPMRVVARDGHPLGSAAFTCDTLGVNPGERWDVVITCDEPGAWAFHCHILQHAEGPDGMYGMVTALVVQDQAAAAQLQAAGAPAFACVVPARAACPDQPERTQADRTSGHPGPTPGSPDRLGHDGRRERDACDERPFLGCQGRGPKRVRERRHERDEDLDRHRDEARGQQEAIPSQARRPGAPGCGSRTPGRPVPGRGP